MLYVTIQCTPPLTAQTDHHKDLKFGMDTHLVPNRGVIEVIFEEVAPKWIYGAGLGYPWGGKNGKKIFFDFFFVFCTDRQII